MRVSSVTNAPSRLRRLWREAITDADMHYGGFAVWCEHLARLGIGDVRGLDVLDIGGGERAPLSLLFAAAGARVTSLDSLPVAVGRRRPQMWLAIARSQGLGPGVHRIVRDFAHTFRYWGRLERQAGRRLPFDRVRMVQADAARLPFGDESFDIVISSAVWEHLSDVEAATREVNRVLRPSGIAAIQIALFPALQGGHHAEWHATDPAARRGIRPWDHLYPDRKPLPTYLNEWRESQYREVIDRAVRVIEWEDGELRGSSFLGDDVQADLSEFSRRDLLLSSLTAWAQSRATPRRIAPSNPPQTYRREHH